MRSGPMKEGAYGKWVSSSGWYSYTTVSFRGGSLDNTYRVVSSPPPPTYISVLGSGVSFRAEGSYIPDPIETERYVWADDCYRYAPDIAETPAAAPPFEPVHNERLFTPDPELGF